jgi:hypothetical protein
LYLYKEKSLTHLLSRTITLRTLLRTAICLGTLTYVLSLMAAQPHMEAALSSLRAARQSLIQATANKGGHRANAIKLTDQAITEVETGIAVAR